MAVRIRRATVGDLPQLLDLLPQLATEATGSQLYDVPEEGAAGAFRQIDAHDDHALLVAEDDGRVVGTLHLVIVPNLTHDARPWAIVENLVVEESRRRSGVGRQLLEAAVGRAREERCYKVQLLSRTGRAGAHELYSSVGFQPSAVGFRLYLDD